MVVTNTSTSWVATSQCPRTGRLRKRASPIERMLARICRKQGRVRFNAFLRDMNDDERRIEVLAQDLPWFGGVQLAIDSGEPQPHAADVKHGGSWLWRKHGMFLTS